MGKIVENQHKICVDETNETGEKEKNSEKYFNYLLDAIWTYIIICFDSNESSYET